MPVCVLKRLWPEKHLCDEYGKAKEQYLVVEKSVLAGERLESVREKHT